MWNTRCFHYFNLFQSQFVIMQSSTGTKVKEKHEMIKFTHKQKQLPEMFYKNGVLKNFTKFLWKHLFWLLFLKMTLQHRCFPVNFVNFLRIPFYRTTPVAASWKKVWLIKIWTIRFFINCRFQLVMFLTFRVNATVFQVIQHSP